MNAQKQPQETFCKKMCSWKFHKIHRKTPVPETFYNKVGSGIIKETLVQVFSCEFCEISKKTFLQNTSVRLHLNVGY